MKHKRYRSWGFLLYICMYFSILSMNQVSAEEVEEKLEREFTIEDVWGYESGNFERIFKSTKDDDLNLDKALHIICREVFGISSDQEIDTYQVFAEIRSEYQKAELSDQEIMQFVDDAIELKKKYPIILNFVIRSKYAKEAVKEGLDTDEVLALASSEYIHLPKFILKDSFEEKSLNEVLTDLGSGVIWKDRMKYLYIFKKYEGKEEKAIVDKLTNCSRQIKFYLQLLYEISKIFKEAHSHIAYIIAQDFFFDDLPKEKIMNIFSLSENDWKSIVKPKN